MASLSAEQLRASFGKKKPDLSVPEAESEPSTGDNPVVQVGKTNPGPERLPSGSIKSLGAQNSQPERIGDEPCLTNYLSNAPVEPVRSSAAPSVQPASAAASPVPTPAQEAPTPQTPM